MRTLSNISILSSKGLEITFPLYSMRLESRLRRQSGSSQEQILVPDMTIDLGERKFH